jgi:hypothetical protein
VPRMQYSTNVRLKMTDGEPGIKTIISSEHAYQYFINVDVTQIIFILLPILLHKNL